MVSRKSVELDGPASIAGLRGPDLRELAQLKPPAVVAPGREGEVKAATGGRRD